MQKSLSNYFESVSLKSLKGLANAIYKLLEWLLKLSFLQGNLGL